MRNGHCLPAAGQAICSALNLERLKDSRSTKSTKTEPGMAIPATGTSLQGDNSHNVAPGVTSRQFSRKDPWLQRRGSPRKAARTTPGLWEGKVVVLIHPLPSSRSARSCT